MALLSNETTLFKELNLIGEAKDISPKDFYNFLLHKVVNVFKDKLAKGITTDPKSKASYERLAMFIWERSYLKKAIITIPYNVSYKFMVNYIKDELDVLEDGWYKPHDKSDKYLINIKDIILLTHTIKDVIFKDSEKMKNLVKYLNNIAKGFFFRKKNTLELPITWTLPTGLTVKQSYLETKKTSLTPFFLT